MTPDCASAGGWCSLHNVGLPLAPPQPTRKLRWLRHHRLPSLTSPPPHPTAKLPELAEPPHLGHRRKPRFSYPITGPELSPLVANPQSPPAAESFLRLQFTHHPPRPILPTVACLPAPQAALPHLCELDP
ncbi:hypothetical protein MY11210_009081 [Beauveria gryllotalpidicola]